MDNRRIRKLRNGEEGMGSIVYWMDRELRVLDNWAMYASIRLAKQKSTSVEIVVHLNVRTWNYTLRFLDFFCKSIQEVAETAEDMGIKFTLLQGDNPASDIVQFVQTSQAKILVTDMSPLRESREKKSYVAEHIEIPFLEVDAHNIVPVWTASPKLEYQAATFRPKINRLLPEFLTSMPEMEAYRIGAALPSKKIDIEEIIRNAVIDRTVAPAEWIVPGSAASNIALRDFIEQRSLGYDTLRNDPNAQAQSNLSPYLRYGNISPQRVALEVQNSNMAEASKAAFLEELIVRREVADNFCWYSPNYDRFSGAWNWAQESLETHWDDAREFLYTLEQFELAQTHDTLWNAAQREMMVTGKMHGFMRMYWAKKILEWSENPEIALGIAIYLNDKYELDGKDPNGYTGVMWSICGVHDRAWFERSIFGKIRYMNRNGCERKFDVDEYVSRWIA